MSRRRCNYSGCKNKSAPLRFFKFPVNDERRCEKWILCSGNPRLMGIEKSKLRTLCICEDHFDEECFVNATHHRLIKSAVPKHFSGTSMSPISEIYDVTVKSEVYDEQPEEEITFPEELSPSQLNVIRTYPPANKIKLEYPMNPKDFQEDTDSLPKKPLPALSNPE